MSPQAAFAESIWANDGACPPGLSAWNGSDPARRFAVYRNNVMVSLIDALADTFPVVQALVGEEFFRAMAALYARAHPPTSPVMACYGIGFDRFLREFPPAGTLPYLADMARLELAYVAAFHAADAPQLAAERLAQLMAQSDDLPNVRIGLHPSAGIIASPFAIASLWFAHQASDADDIAAALAKVDPYQAQAVLVVRQGLNVTVHLIEAATADFVSNLGMGARLGEAVVRTTSAHPGFDLAGALALLLRGGALHSLNVDTESHP